MATTIIIQRDRMIFPILSGLTHKTKETGFLAGDFADKINIYRSETRFGA